MNNVITGKQRRHLKYNTNKRIKNLEQNDNLSYKDKQRLSKRIKKDLYILNLTLDELADHHYDYWSIFIWNF